MLFAGKNEQYVLSLRSVGELDPQTRDLSMTCVAFTISVPVVTSIFYLPV